MQDSPVVLIHGPRQSGKSTLATAHGNHRGYRSLTFDDTAVLNLAQSDPAGFVADLPDRVILDEVQRVPGLFLALKMAVERSPTRSARHERMAKHTGTAGPRGAAPYRLAREADQRVPPDALPRPVGGFRVCVP